MPAKGIFPPKKKTRRARIERLLYLLDNKKPTEKPSQVVAQFCIKEAVSSRKAREYVKLLFLTKKINEEVFNEIKANVPLL